MRQSDADAAPDGVDGIRPEKDVEGGMERGMPQMLPEYRMRLLTGLKQFYRAKYEEGILGVKVRSGRNFPDLRCQRDSPVDSNWGPTCPLYNSRTLSSLIRSPSFLQAFQILSHCCDAAHHSHIKPLDLWGRVRKELSVAGFIQVGCLCSRVWYK